MRPNLTAFVTLEYVTMLNHKMQLFPTWAANAPDFTMNDKTVILSDTELTGLRRLCSLQVGRHPSSVNGG